MGIKLLKEKLNTGYIVQRCGDSICISSHYCHDLITIKKDGEAVIKNRLLNGGSSVKELNELVEKVQKAAASGELKDWICTPDTFENLKPVYTCEYGRVVKKYCEEYGWPNLTTEGEIMYDNTFFRTRKEALGDGLKNTRAGVILDTSHFIRHIKEFIERVFFFIKHTYLPYIRIRIFRGWF